jgi:DNA polymerase IV
VDALWGVGPKTAARLRAAGIARLVDVRTAAEEVLRAAVGSYAETLRRMAFGQDDRPVEPNRERKSVGSENTFAEDLKDIEAMRKEIRDLALSAARYLERKDLLARTVVLKLRYSNFETITRSRTENPPTRSPEEIAARALSLLDKTDAAKRPVRLLGVSLHGLSENDAAPAGQGSPPDELPFEGQQPEIPT